MLPNAYTKKEILENLASKGQFIDSYTLDAFFEKWEIEAIFEDEAGQEFFDKSALDLVCQKLFNNAKPGAENMSYGAGAMPPANSLNPIQPQEINLDEIQPVNINPTMQTGGAPNIRQGLNQAPSPQPMQGIPKPKTDEINLGYGNMQQRQIPGQQAYGQSYQAQMQQPQSQPRAQQYQGAVPNAQMPYGSQAQFQNPAYQPNALYPNASYQQNTPYQPQAQQAYGQQYNSFPSPNMSMPAQNEWKQGAAPQKVDLSQEFSINDPQTSKILNSIPLSDGNSLMSKIKSDTGAKDYSIPGAIDLSDDDILKPLRPEEPSKSGLLGGAMAAAGITELGKQEEEPVISTDAPDIDDISLLSESMEAQEKLREYVVSELAKKNVDLTPQGNEFKLDISERTINMVARTVAKKIAKNVTTILLNETKNSPQGIALREENEKLTKRAKELESENKKLRLLLMESNKNINSFKSIWGLFYIKTKPKSKPKPISNTDQDAKAKPKK